MNRQQLSLVVILGLISSIPAFAAGPSEQGGGWQTSSEEAASSTLSGKLYRNSADSSGSAPYIVLDRWGVVRGYVAAAQGVELESCVGQQVSLQGTVKTLPGGEMPYMTCQRVVGGNAEPGRARVQHTSASAWSESSAPVAQDQRSQETAPQLGLPTRNDMSAGPAPRIAALPLREVVLEPQAMPAADDSQDRVSPPPARRAIPRRAHAAGVQASNYQEIVPTPVPSGELHQYPMATHPAIDPTPMEEGQMVPEGAMAGCGHGGCEACREGPCDAGCEAGPCNACCDDFWDQPCWGPRRPLFCIGPTGIWVKADYLQWWESGTHVPALVTTGPNASNPGHFGEAGTTVLFGDGTINNNSESGGRIQAGMWLNPCATIGFEGEYFGLADENTNYYNWSDGNPILSRPFFDTSVNQERVELIAFPRGNLQSIDGSIYVSAKTSFQGAGRTSSSPCAARKAAGPTNAAPRQPTTTATARTLSPAIGTWTWKINSA